ncbi:triphosphoribosyl-dephospho-CoA synthase [Nonomuraea jiangxiensis]|uniref:triphosphoribosyl-dephospho-CoA synthase n=1 Tax=Nonomuraea jiangxiensis TaxID=633440 RepID=A0A1G8TGR4_9ACTN|nr:triphosphoribosyl-dephospho-CoA synthase [Nonomuraea jiangxiensis]SDJ40756.1 triphosphoribosyl-dephospho-CoA synthase [Nonomuraea jiangxiensis]
MTRPPGSGPGDPAMRADVLAGTAVRALCAEALLSPKPGLVDARGGGAHDDMDLPLLLASAEALRPTFRAVAFTAKRLFGVGLREELGRLGRAGDRAMSRATGEVNTHRGALWALGLLVAAVAGGADDERAAAGDAAGLAALPDRWIPVGPASHGELVRRRYGTGGARGEAEAGFPHVIEVALPRLRLARADGRTEEVARLDALLAVMSLLHDTCVLHRGGRAGLRVVQLGASAVLAEGGAGTDRGRAALLELDDRLRGLRLSPGGSGDLLAAALFLDLLPWPRRRPRAEREVMACRR